jgi:hypothetical protein
MMLVPRWILGFQLTNTFPKNNSHKAIRKGEASTQRERTVRLGGKLKNLQGLRIAHIFNMHLLDLGSSCID